jgi:hypothetical protein
MPDMAETNTSHTEPAADRPKATRRRTPTPAQRLLTFKQIEDEYGVPVRSSYELAVSGRLPTVRFRENGQRWVRRADWEALIDASTSTEHAS